MKNKILRVGIVLGALMILFITIMNVFFASDELAIVKQKAYWSSGIISEVSYIPLKDGEVEQTFTAQAGSLDRIYLFFDNYSAQDTAMVFVTVEDHRGKVIGSWNANTGSLIEGTYCLLLYPEKKTHNNKEYTVRVYLDSQDSNITLRALENREFHESMGELKINGTVKENAALYFVHEYTARYSFVVMGVVAFIVAAGFCIVGVIVPDKAKYLRWALACLIPVIAFVGIEILSGNLGLTAVTDIWKNILLIAMILLLGRCIIGKYADYIVVVLAFLVGTVNYYVTLTRGSEFVLADIRSFSTAMTVAGNYELPISAAMIMVAAVSLLIIFVGIYLDRIRKEKTTIVERIITGGLGAVAVLVMSLYVLPNSKVLVYDISSCLKEKGWCYGNVCLLQAGSISKPDGYSEQEVQNILEKYDGEPEEKVVTVPENLIVIMNESLSDLQILGDLEVSNDSLPFIRSLSENTVKGNLHVPVIGGSTCNTEYEFLTGNSMHFINTSIIPYMVLCESEEAGISSVVRSQGYYTVAMHPYIRKNWNRDRVYDAMGFEEYLDGDAFAESEKLRNYVSDKGDYDKIIEYYENFDKDEKLFIFNVTMQNHGGYDINSGTIEKTVELENVDCGLAENYLSLIKESDEAFEYLLDYFSKVEEPTMIVMFGDHQPSLPTDFYEQLNSASTSGKNTEGDNERYKYVTPYIIWTNYESDFEEIPEMSVNYLSSYVLQCAGLELTEYQEFLLQMMDVYPVVGKLGVGAADGTYTPYNENTAQWLKDYEMLQYMRIEDRRSKSYSIFSVGE